MSEIKIIVSFLLIIGLSSCDGLFKDDDDHEVRYEVTGTAEFISILYIEGTDNSFAIEHQQLPWSHSFRGEKGEIVYLQATNETETGEIRVVIHIDGNLFLEARNNEPFGIATVSGRIAQ
jgi:hypothetical protein